MSLASAAQATPGSSRAPLAVKIDLQKVSKAFGNKRVLDELDLAPPDGVGRPSVDGATTLRDALSLMLTTGSKSLDVVDVEGGRLGVVTLDSLAATER